MNIYLLTQDENRGYDTYDSIVVVAKTEEEARYIMPSNYEKFGDNYGSWATHPEAVQVSLIGKAVKGTEAGVILASFNAG